MIAEAEGVWVTDVDGRRYLDCLAGYSALNFGHRHPQLIAAAHEQLDRVTLTSRAFVHDQFGPFCHELATLCGTDLVLPMNTGAEAVETAIKLARKWGYLVKGVPDGQAKIIVAADNFHGRTTTIISFSTDPDARNDFGPYTPGFVVVPYGDLDALTAAIDDNTVAVLIEPIQGEAGVIVPPAGYLAGVRAVTSERHVLFIADEIQSGLGRTGTNFAVEHEGVVPDMYILGKALGGGVVPVSAVAGSKEVLGTLKPGEHGSTFGGNPLACAVARSVIALLNTGEFQARATELGERLHATAARAGRSRRDRRPRAWPLGRRRHRSGAHDRPGGEQAPDGARRAREGHARLDDPPRAAAAASPPRRSTGRSTGSPRCSPRPSNARKGPDSNESPGPFVYRLLRQVAELDVVAPDLDQADVGTGVRCLPPHAVTGVDRDVVRVRAGEARRPGRPASRPSRTPGCRSASWSPRDAAG